jgi:hypothetical protein
MVIGLKFNLEKRSTPVYEVKKKDEVIVIEDFVKEAMPNYPSKLENPLAVIVETQKYLTKKDKYSYYQSRKDDAPYISVQVTSKELIDRSLLFLDTLLKQFIARGHEVLSENWGTKVIIQKHSIPIRMRESYNRIRNGMIQRIRLLMEFFASKLMKAIKG